MKTILLSVMLAISMNAIAQKTYETSTDPKNGQVVFSGPITFADLEKESTFDWMREGEEAYKPKKKPTAYLQEHLKDYSIVLFMGTWCPDSHNLVPKFKKLLETIHYPMNQLAIVGVDRSKTLKDGAEKKYNISNVPTFILFRNEKEVGRITESVHKNLERDLAHIIKDCVAH